MDLRSLRIGTVVLALLAVGCEEETPVEKCESLFDTYCDRIVECTSTAAQMAATDYRKICHDAIESAIDCSKAVAVDESYDDCRDQIESNECIVLFPLNPVTNTLTVALPSACKGAIKVQQ